MPNEEDLEERGNDQEQRGNDQEQRGNDQEERDNGQEERGNDQEHEENRQQDVGKVNTRKRRATEASSLVDLLSKPVTGKRCIKPVTQSYI